MAVLDWMQPREIGAARQTVALLCGVGVTVTVITYPLLADDAPATEACWPPRRSWPSPRSS